MGTGQNHIHLGFCTDRGLVRKANEDAYGYDQKLGLYLVADGVGGSVGGAHASRLAIKTVLDSALTDSARAVDDPASFLETSFREANRHIMAEGVRNPDLAEMGTTLVGMLLLENRAIIAHIGDSRLYLYREDEITLQTQDHTLIQDMVNSGAFTMDIARNLPFRHVITRCLGMSEDGDADVDEFSLKDGDRVLLCTDGLTEHLSDEEIACVLCVPMDSPNETCAELVNIALDRGGQDNVTVLLVDYGPEVDEATSAT